MTNVSTRPQQGANRSAAAEPRTAGTALPVVDRPPMQPTGLVALRDASTEAIHWWSKLECLRENNAHGVNGKDTLPAWAVAVIGSYEEQHAWIEAHRQSMDRAKQAMQLSERGETTMVYEVWTKRGHRLDGQYDFMSEASAACVRWLEKYPDAHVTRVHRKSVFFGGSIDVGMLDTLVGRVFWAGCSFPDDGDEEIHTVQDDTGRCVSAPLSALVTHSVMKQMTKDAQERVAFGALAAQRKAALRAEAEKGGV